MGLRGHGGLVKFSGLFGVADDFIALGQSELGFIGGNRRRRLSNRVLRFLGSSSAAQVLDQGHPGVGRRLRHFHRAAENRLGFGLAADGPQELSEPNVIAVILRFLGHGFLSPLQGAAGVEVQQRDFGGQLLDFRGDGSLFL